MQAPFLAVALSNAWLDVIVLKEPVSCAGFEVREDSANRVWIDSYTVSSAIQGSGGTSSL